MSNTLNLLIIDDNRLIIGPLTKYLVDRYGSKIVISAFKNPESCLLKIDRNSHVLILDYFSGPEDKVKNGLNMYHTIKSQSPLTKVTVFSSTGDITHATDEIKHHVNEYVMKRAKYLPTAYRGFQQGVLHPMRQRIREFTIQDYLVMFIISFLAMAVIYFACIKLFSRQ